MRIHSDQGVARTLASGSVSGPNASALKYDIMTALLVVATCAEATEARLSLRLALVITARYSWRRKTFTVGLKELARMWGVTDRTAKRDMAKMRALGWISVEKQAARGRVAEHRINLPILMQMTMPYWNAVGTDFAARMLGTPHNEDSATTNVVPLHSSSVPIPAEDGTIWPAVAELLRSQDAAIYAAWFSQITLVDRDGDILVFTVQSKFTASYIQTHLQTRLMMGIAACDRSVRGVRFIAINEE